MQRDGENLRSWGLHCCNRVAGLGFGCEDEVMRVEAGRQGIRAKGDGS